MPARARSSHCAPGARLVEIAAQDQGVEGEGRVPHPAEAVVPVAHPAQPLGQRRGRGGDDAAGGLVDHGLDRDEGAQHRLAIGALVGAAPGPLPPPRLGLRHRGVGVHRLRGGQVRGVPGQREGAPLTGRDGEVGDGGEPFAMERHVRGEQERVGPGHRPDAAGRAAHPRHHRAIVHADHQLHPHGHRAPETDDLPDDHRGPGPLRHAVHERDRAGVRLEPGLEHERVVAVAPLRPSACRRAGRGPSAHARGRPAGRQSRPGSRSGARRASRWSRRARRARRSRRRR